MEPKVFYQVGEPSVRFEFDARPYLSNMQRIKDFLLGAGITYMPTCFDFVWRIEMPFSVKQRWNQLVEDLNRSK